MDSGTAFKLQPAVMELGMGFMMILMRFKGKSFLLTIMSENPMLSQEQRNLLLGNAVMRARLIATDTRLIVFFCLHGLALAAAAIWGTTSQWILLKGVLFYVLMVAVMLPMYRRTGLASAQPSTKG